MNGFCPNCEIERPVRLVEEREVHRVRNLEIELDVEFLKCEECGLEFDDPKNDDTVERAFHEYRRIKGMVQPETVRAFRKEYGLTQQEFARLLGWGGATLSRYENGALQDDAHDRALGMALHPNNLLELIRNHPDSIGTIKRRAIEEKIGSEPAEGANLLELIEASLGPHSPNELNGFQQFLADKFFNAVLFFCRAENGAFKTKLNKLLWYADQRHFKKQGVSITGTRYAHCPHGPAPDKFELLFTYLIEGTGDLVRENRNDGGWATLVPTRGPDMNVFSPSELATLVKTQEFFQKYTAREISDYSHEEVAYQSTTDGEIISYELPVR